MNKRNHSIIANYTFKKVTAVAHSNIALVKYWGKRSLNKNLPAVGSVSMTLDALKTTTTLQFDENIQKDQLYLDGEKVGPKSEKRITDFIDRAVGGEERPGVKMESMNNFPTGAGLASSASGFAALALALNECLNLNYSNKQLSILARMGSGSAARSIYGGFAEMKLGTGDEGYEDYAISLYDEDYWDVRLLVAITSTEEKKLGSTEGMNRTSKTAPYYDAWVSSHPKDIQEIKDGLKHKDFQKVGELTEHSCFKMHGLAMAARPSIIYWNAATVETIHRVRNLREKGIPAFVTIDAGPQVKVLCLPESVSIVKKTISEINGVRSVIEAKPGSAAKILTSDKETIT